MPSPKKKKGDVSVVMTMAPPKLDVVNVPIVSETPIISNAFPRKALMKILADHMHLPEAMLPKEAKNPVANYEGCIHYLKTGDGQMHCAMPGASFKAALVAACRMTELDMTTAKQLFQVIPHRIRIYGDAPVMCEHRVRNTSGVVDIRHRAMYCRWSAILPIKFHANSISRETILTLAQLAGFGCGIGDWRIAAPKSNNGQMGAWRLALDSEKHLLGEEYSDWCASHPFNWDEMEMYGIVTPERVEYYAQCAAVAAAAKSTPVGNGEPVKAKGKGKGSKRGVSPTEENALAVMHGVMPVNGIEPPNDGYVPQE